MRVFGMPVLVLAAWVAQAAPLGPLAVDISTVGNTLSFDKQVLRAQPGQQVQLTFHNGADVGSGMKHTWVLVKPGTEDEVASEAIAAGSQKNYIPDDPNVLAHTTLVNPGESQTIRFTAPQQPGRYPYLCTFPAHSRMLKGTLQVG